MENILRDSMEEALEEAYVGIAVKDGGPFGAVVIKDGEIVGRGHNRVLVDKDPTAHGEIVAIRDACNNLGTHDLTGCILLTTASPCLMCLGAIMWSNIKEVYYGCTIQDTDDLGFRDGFMYDWLQHPDDNILKKEGLMREECLKLFETYKSIENKELY